MTCPKIWIKGHPRSLNMASFVIAYRQTTDRQQTDGSCHKPNVTS